ncbi:helix-turn-helix domain-containing protein [Hymenobacter sp. BT186]|uniref:Helix-turn-helix domain-containing protein n=1 Tax=Hymenobacter telluris TaxID=2816474 RepID=A0A939JF56_9BACT|nr:helix-turn-helix domain-containing protein [Hymenobacter telluris]MBO0360658.1 helix-turn-helix domain-containing protein [Hymenobacter telluris]MBW3376685.1 helix-turn-helix domain-containing protein [Hymenobacter norwichensis]
MSVDANHLATKGDLEALALRLLEQLRPALPAPTPPEEYLPLEEVAQATRVSVRTVKKWVTEGKPDQKGRIIKLLAVEFSPGYLRVPRAALLAYGQGLGFTIADLRSVPPLRVAS